MTVNPAPVAPSPNVSYTVAPRLSLKIKISELLGQWTGTSLSVASAGPSSGQGGTVSLGASYIYYLPPAGKISSDTIPYTVSGANGCTTAGTIDLNIVAEGGTALRIDVVNGKATVTFAGIPDYPYVVERAEDSGFTVNVAIVLTTNAPPQGLFTFVDNDPPASQAYYRLKCNP